MARSKPSLVLKNASIVNVFTQTIDKKDVAINDNIIVGIGEYDGITKIDCTGLFVSPGFIDSHVHIESSMVTPEALSHVLIKKGVTTIIADPHEIANVLGEDGIKFMIESSKKGVIDEYFMLPSCVPAVEFEDNGATLSSEELAKFIDYAGVLGIGEVMDVNAVTSNNENMLRKIMLAASKNKNIDGHCPHINTNQLNAYICSGIRTDHECSNSDEALEKIGRGMYVLLREGSAAKNLKDLLKAVNNKNFQRFLFCTDDRHIEDLFQEGSIDNCIRLAISGGMDPIIAYTIATLNASICYGLRDRGAIAPGMKADIVIFENLEKLNIKNVIKDGKVYNGKGTSSEINYKPSVSLACIDKGLFKVKDKSGKINVIGAKPCSLETKKLERKVLSKDGFIEKVIECKDKINKIAVIERHKNSGKSFVGFIEGIGLKNAAIAQTIAHDSHNIIVAGDNDDDMEIAVNNLIKNDGGIVLASEGKVLEFLSLPIGGLMSFENPALVLEKVKNLNRLARSHGIPDGIDPFLTLGFMALPVIPDLKITPRGLFDYKSFSFIDLFC